MTICGVLSVTAPLPSSAGVNYVVTVKKGCISHGPPSKWYQEEMWTSIKMDRDMKAHRDTHPICILIFMNKKLVGMILLFSSKILKGREKKGARERERESYPLIRCVAFQMAAMVWAELGEPSIRSGNLVNVSLLSVRSPVALVITVSL